MPLIKSALAKLATLNNSIIASINGFAFFNIDEIFSVTSIPFALCCLSIKYYWYNYTNAILGEDNAAVAVEVI
jgi:hypothetical protein